MIAASVGARPTVSGRGRVGLSALGAVKSHVSATETHTSEVSRLRTTEACSPSSPGRPMNQPDDQAPSEGTGTETRPTAPLDPLEVRNNPRVGADLAVELYATDFGGALLGRTRDLSIGGACIATPSPFNVKNNLTFSIPM